MANMYDISSLTYQPSSNMDWFTKAVFGGKLIEKGKITPIIGVKESTQLNLIDIAGNILQADVRDCACTPQHIANLSEKELKVKGMSCEHCVKRVKSAVEGVEGVSSVSVDLNSGAVKYNAEKDVTKEVIEKIKEAGYEAE